MFSPETLNKFSPNWVTSILGDNLKDENNLIPKTAPFVNQLVRSYPTAVVVQLGEIVQRIRSLIDRVTQGLEMILLLVLACGGLVLFAAIAVSYDERLRENAVLRTLGSSRKVVLGSLTTEFVVLGAIAGLIASIGSEAILYFVQVNLFELPASLHPNLWGIGMFSGIVIITLIGLWRSREIITVPPLESLKQIA